MEFTKTEAQRIFAACVEAAVKRAKHQYMADIDAEDLGLYYTFHEPDQVSVDGTLYDVLAYGQAEFGYGKQLYREIDERLAEAGYLMERDTNCDYRFYKHAMLDIKGE